MLLRVLRVARILRILRLLKGAKEIRDLLVCMVLSFPPLINVGSVLCLVCFMFAVLGVNLFTYVAPGDDLNEDRNFVTFTNACLLLFQCLTGDGWSAIMDDAMVDEERGCDPDAVPTDCGSTIAIPYFISFTVIGSFVMLNLVVAVILENFTALGNVNQELVSTNDITEFKEQWGMYDPDADGKIPARSSSSRCSTRSSSATTPRRASRPCRRAASRRRPSRRSCWRGARRSLTSTSRR